MRITKETTKKELKTYLDSLMYRFVTRKRKTHTGVKGQVVGYIAKRKNRQIDGEWVVKLVVEWEGASNGAIRFNGSAWNTKSTLKIESLIFE